MIVGVLQTAISTSCYVDDDCIDVCDDFNGVPECDNYRCKCLINAKLKKNSTKKNWERFVRRFRCIHTHINIYVHQPLGEIS